VHYVVTQPCCGDPSCVYACPVNCIHPTPDEPDFGTVEMLHIDPATCIGCGACVSACPVDAITPAADLTPQQHPFLQSNADFYKNRSADRPVMARVTRTPAARPDDGPLRVALVGAGPAALCTRPTSSCCSPVSG
jgi:ferredoxin--NADP+ reductase